MANITTDESQLLLRARDMDVRALGKIHDQYYPEIYRYAYYRTSEETVAEDIASEVFLRLLVGLRSGRPPKTTLRGWLFGVASHLIADHFRNQFRLSQLNTVASNDSSQVEAETNLRHNELLKAIHNLTVQQQEVLALRFGEGLSVEETAQVIGKSVQAVKSLQFRAVEALRSEFIEVEV